MTKPDIASQQNLLVPALVESDEVTDVSVTHVGLLRQHPRHEHVVYSEDPFVAVLEHLEKLIPDQVAHDVHHAPAVGREELIGPLVIRDHLTRIG